PVLMLALVLGWVILRSLLHRRTAGMPLTLRHNGWLGGFFSILSACAGPVLGIALGIGLAAPAWLALIDYVQGSARVAQNSSAHWQWLVPWQSWPGLVLPSWTVNWSDFSSRNLSHTGTELACEL